MHSREEGEEQREAERSQQSRGLVEEGGRDVAEAGGREAVADGGEAEGAERGPRVRERVEAERKANGQHGEPRHVRNRVGDEVGGRREPAARGVAALSKKDVAVLAEGGRARQRQRHAQRDRDHEVHQLCVLEGVVDVQQTNAAARERLYDDVARDRRRDAPLLQERAPRLQPQLHDPGRRRSGRCGRLQQQRLLLPLRRVERRRRRMLPLLQHLPRRRGLRPVLQRPLVPGLGDLVGLGHEELHVVIRRRPVRRHLVAEATLEMPLRAGGRAVVRRAAARRQKENVRKRLPDLERRLVDDGGDGGALLRESAEHFDHFQRRRRVEAGRRLVGEHAARIRHQFQSDVDALALASRNPALLDGADDRVPHGF
mmetsp:Transcript_17718/g.54057  ORF Transcript_17718/g.54057 Transcript_17718/m.54057 type:complete len:371 (+) Transcript_17718:698-1810(+)